MRGLDLSRVNKEIWDGCPLLPRGPPDTSAVEQPCTFCDTDSDLSDSSAEFSDSGFISSGDSTNQLRDSLLSDASDDEGSGDSAAPSLPSARDSSIASPRREAPHRMESQCSRIPRPEGTGTSQARTPEPHLDAPRDWATFLRQGLPQHTKGTGIPKPRSTPGVTKPRGGRRSHQALGTTSLPWSTPTQVGNRARLNRSPTPVPRLDWGQASSHDNDEDRNSEGDDSARYHARTSIDDSTRAYSADELSQVSSVLGSEMPSEIPSEILAEMASEMPSELPVLEPRRTPRSIRLAKLTVQDQAPDTHGDGLEHDQQGNDDSSDGQNGVSDGDAVGSPYLQGMGCMENELHGGMHISRGSDGEASPFLHATGLNDVGCDGSAITYSYGMEGVGVEKDEAMLPSHGSGEQLTENEWASEGDQGDAMDGVPLGGFDDQESIDVVSDWLQYAEHTSGEEGSDGDIDSSEVQPLEGKGCSKVGSFQNEKELGESPALWDSRYSLSNAVECAPQSNEPNHGQDADVKTTGSQIASTLGTPVDYVPGVDALVCGPPPWVGVLPLESPFQTQTPLESEEQGGAPNTAAIMEVTVGANEPLFEINLNSPQVNATPKLHSEGHAATPGVGTARDVDGDSTPGDNKEGCFLGGQCVSGKVLVSEHSACNTAKLAFDESGTMENDVNENGSREPKFQGMPAQVETDEVIVCGNGLKDSGGVHPSSDMQDQFAASAPEGEQGEQHGMAAEKKGQGCVERDISVASPTIHGHNVWGHLGIVVMLVACAALLASIAILEWRAFNAPFIERKSSSGMEPPVLFELVPLLEPHHNFTTPSPPITRTDGRIDDDMVCDATDDAIGSELAAGEAVAAGSNSFNPATERGTETKLLWEMMPDMLWIVLPTSLLSWVKVMESIVGALTVFWLLFWT